MSQNYLNSLYYKTKNEWIKDYEIDQTSLYQNTQMKKDKKRKKRRCNLDLLEKQLDDYIDTNYNRQIYKHQLKENSLYQVTSKIKKQQKMYKYKDCAFQMQNSLDIIDKVVESVLEYNNRQNFLIRDQTFLHYLAQRHKEKEEQENLQREQMMNNSSLSYSDDYDASSKYTKTSNFSQYRQKNNIDINKQQKEQLNPQQRKLERLRIRELELKKYEEEQRLKKYSSLIDRHKKQVDRMYDDYQTRQFKKYNDEMRQIELEKLERLKKQKQDQDEWLRRKNLKVKMFKKLKIVFLSIQLFKRSARDYKIRVKKLRVDFDSQQTAIIDKLLKPCLDQVSIGFIKNILEQYDSSNQKHYIVTNDKFFLNDYQQEPIKPKKLVQNSEYLLNIFGKFILDFQNIVVQNNTIISNLNDFFVKTFTKNQFILRDFFSKEFLNRLKLTNYGQLKQEDQIIKRNALIFILINKIMIPIMIKAANHQKQEIGSRMVCKVLVSVFYQAQENCQEENLKQQDNNQANLSHEFQIQPLKDQIIDQKLHKNNQTSENYFIDILQSKKMKELFSTENKVFMNDQINNMVLKIMNFMDSDKQLNQLKLTFLLQ